MNITEKYILCKHCTNSGHPESQKAIMGIRTKGFVY